MKDKKYNTKLGIYEKDGAPKLRIWHRKRKGINSARYLIKCGDCDTKLEIFYGDDDEFLEIGGINASQKEWRKILLPLLNDIKKNGQRKKTKSKKFDERK